MLAASRRANYAAQQQSALIWVNAQSQEITPIAVRGRAALISSGRFDLRPPGT
jgi:hypothetical protein